MIARFIGIVAIFLFFILVIWFNFLNPEIISINFNIYHFTSKASIVFSLIFLCGWIFGISCCSYYIFKLINKKRILSSKLKSYKDEITSLRKKPLDNAN
jgi:uncharacterized membrane protein YciS (DUF1049 family)